MAKLVQARLDEETEFLTRIRPIAAVALVVPPRAAGAAIPRCFAPFRRLNAKDQLPGRLQQLQTSESRNAGPVNCIRWILIIASVQRVCWKLPHTQRSVPLTGRP